MSLKPERKAVEERELTLWSNVSFSLTNLVNLVLLEGFGQQVQLVGEI